MSRFPFDLSKLPRCGAKARSRGGLPCKRAAMKNGRCDFHGGKSPIKHGSYTRSAYAARTQQRVFINQARKQLKGLMHEE